MAELAIPKNDPRLLIGLLSYYDSVTRQNRAKITYLGGIYLALMQLTIFTPQSTLDAMKTALRLDTQPSYGLIYAIGFGSVTVLLTVGVLHHVCNLMTACAQRMKYEFRCIVADRREDASSWKTRLDSRVASVVGLSRVSGLIAIVLMMSLFVVSYIRFCQIVLHFFSGAGPLAIIFLTIYTLTTAIIIVFYVFVIYRRWDRFYFVRNLVRELEQASDWEGVATKIV